MRTSFRFGLALPLIVSLAAALLTPAAAQAAPRPQAAHVGEKPVICQLAGRGQSVFARTNISESSLFAQTRTADFDHRLIQADPADPAFVTPAAAITACANGTDERTGQPWPGGAGTAPRPASIMIEIIGFTRPPWTASARDHDGKDNVTGAPNGERRIEYFVIRAAKPATGAFTDNMHWYSPQEYRAWYVKGIMAGLKTAGVGHVGMLVPFDRTTFDNGAPSFTTVTQYVQNTNAFLLGLRSVKPQAVLTQVSTETFNEVVPAAGWPEVYPNLPSSPKWTGYPDVPGQPGDPYNNGPHAPAATSNCTSPASYFTNPANGPYTGAPNDCVAIDKMLAADPAIDVIAQQKASYFPQIYAIAKGKLVVENSWAESMDVPGPGEPVTNIGSSSPYINNNDKKLLLKADQVLSATEFDFQPVLNKIADDYLAGTLRPLSNELLQTVNGQRTVGLARISNLFTTAQRNQIEQAKQTYLRERNGDPFCGPAAQAALGTVYTFVNGCMTDQDKLYGTAFSPDIPASRRLLCFPQYRATGYPVTCRQP